MIVKVMSIGFQNIFAQDETIERLRGAYRADRLPHGLIFAGPTGVGKATTARALGALFLCEHPGDAQACGVCTSCRAIEGNAHPDYHVITRDLIRYHDKNGKSKGIDLSIYVIRPELLEKASRKPVMGRGKVFLIEQADYMNPQAQNAMLKTLEEPEGRTLIILLTDQLGALLPTIRSRCQAFSFASLDERLVREQLEKRGYPKEPAILASRLSEGSLGEATRWLEDGVIDAVAGLGDKLAAIEAGDGTAGLADWFKKAADAYSKRQLEREPLSSADQHTRGAMALYLRLASQRFRARLRENNSTDDESLDRACDAIDALVKAEALLDANVNVGLVFQQLAATLGRLYRSEAVLSR